MKSILHRIYEIVGHLYASLANIYYFARDYVAPPDEKAVLFVAHPDDDVLFFHTFISEEKPYVVLLTTGGLLKRVIPFCRAMHFYNVRFRFFDLNSRAIEKEELINKRISHVLNRSTFEICATHNAEGEYGHIMHRCIHRCVARNWDGKILVPRSKTEISNYPLPSNEAEKKRKILQTYYKGEYPTLQELDTWINHEGLISINKDS